MSAGSKNLRTVVYQDDGIFIHKPKQIQRGIVLYGQVMGSSRFHHIKKKRTGKGRFSYKCDCEYNFYQEQLCKHIAEFKIGESKLKKKV